MKKVLAIPFVALLCSCANGFSTGESSNQDSAVVTVGSAVYSSEASRLFEPLVAKYPNYKKNELAQIEMAKPIEEYFDSCVGKPFDFTKDLIVEFEEIDRAKGDMTTVWFKTLSMHSYGDTWDCSFRLLVEMPTSEAAKLGDDYYYVTGTLKEWDKNGRFFGTGFHVSSTIWLGTFVITDATVTK